jgi:inner membrane protein
MVFACMAIAAAPDLDLLFQTHRTATHSVGATIFVALVAGTIAANAGLPIARVALVCAAAHASHILLDWLAVDTTPPFGIQALWPFSHEWFISGIGVFRGTAREHFFSPGSIRENTLAVAQEIAILAPIALAAWLVRVKALARLAAEMPGGNHPPE